LYKSRRKQEAAAAMASSETVNENRIVAPDNHKGKKNHFLKLID
jgi:hypothetical protein